MYQVAIIGAGQLGRRHLQGLLHSNLPLIVHVVDPSEASRREVDNLIATSNIGNVSEIHVHESIDRLPNNLEVVVVATTASHRLAVIEHLTHVSKVRHLVLEKFLFNDSEQYAQADALISENGITAWVNTPRRHFDVYRELLKSSSGDQLLQFTVDGGDWGLCCNSIHFIDLVQFMTDESELLSVQSKFDDGVMDSKRSGYVELTGEIICEIGSTRVIVRSVRGSSKPITVTMHYKKKTVFVAEGAGEIYKIGEGEVENKTFQLPYQSEMTGRIIDNLIITNKCGLAPYKDSATAHLALLKLFAKYAGNIIDERAQCAIT